MRWAASTFETRHRAYSSFSCWSAAYLLSAQLRAEPTSVSQTNRVGYWPSWLSPRWPTLHVDEAFQIYCALMRLGRQPLGPEYWELGSFGLYSMGLTSWLRFIWHCSCTHGRVYESHRACESASAWVIALLRWGDELSGDILVASRLSLPHWGQLMRADDPCTP